MAAATVLNLENVIEHLSYLHQMWWADASWPCAHARMTHDQKSKPEANLSDIIKCMSGT